MTVLNSSRLACAGETRARAMAGRRNGSPRLYRVRPTSSHAAARVARHAERMGDTYDGPSSSSLSSSLLSPMRDSNSRMLDAREQQILLDEQLAASLQHDDALYQPEVMPYSHIMQQQHPPSSINRPVTDSAYTPFPSRTYSDHSLSLLHAFNNFSALASHHTFHHAGTFSHLHMTNNSLLMGHNPFSDRSTNYIPDHMLETLDYEDLLRLSDQIGFVKQKGVSKDVIGRLPKIVYTLALFTSHGDKQCAVCLEQYVEGDTLHKLPCAHLFHNDCIVPWLKTDDSCPVCRSSVATLISPSSSLLDHRKRRTKGTLSRSCGLLGRKRLRTVFSDSETTDDEDNIALPLIAPECQEGVVATPTVRPRPKKRKEESNHTIQQSTGRTEPGRNKVTVVIESSDEEKEVRWPHREVVVIDD